MAPCRLLLDRGADTAINDMGVWNDLPADAAEGPGIIYITEQRCHAWLWGSRCHLLWRMLEKNDDVHRTPAHEPGE